MSIATDFPAAELRSLRVNAIAGLLSVAALLGGLGWWAATTVIAGAVISPGTLVVESYPKQVQHQDGGIVSDILVHDGSSVAQGDVLVRLDDTPIRAGLAMVSAQLDEALLQEARLVAQIDDKAQFTIPAELDATAPDIAALAATQQQMLAALRADRSGRVDQLGEQIVQLQHQIDGLEMQRRATENRLAILGDRARGLEDLLARHLAEAGEVSDLHLQQAAAEGEKGRLVAAIAQAAATISEKRLAIEQTLTDFTSQALDELQKTRQTISSARQQKLAADDKLARTVIRAPQAGIVHESAVHTVGGVVAPGQTLMQIVPQADDLLIDIRIDPADIDAVTAGQKVNLRFTSLDHRRTPEAWGKVASVSPDLVIEQQSGRRYYTASVRIDPEELAGLDQTIKLLPGMPVEAFVTTGDRSVLSYLLHPLTEELQLAFREQ